MKTKEELNTLKEEEETVSRKLRDMTDEELAQVTGGANQHGVKDISLYEQTDDVVIVP